MEHRGVTVWFTGLSGAGKTTISQALAKRLKDAGCKLEILDGDIVRTNLTKGLGFSKEDRDENIRRIGFVSHLLTRNGVIVLVSAISPYQAVRDEVRDRIGNFVEVYADAWKLRGDKFKKGNAQKANDHRSNGSFFSIPFPK